MMRTGKLYFSREDIKGDYAILKDKMATALDWSDQQVKDYDEQFTREYEASVTFN